ncbi:hypothetical protein ALNOE001_10760 [Candidatus Methanobinarius endosymbioticus]|uniref:Uncharacterized protein n=1 Tax=Candidatus Methanobinarius endosymbioticus TaxID=2006182 RepID=A0A366MDA0_9EURY|nr:hypothetical protein ALNOE001_10760 [Candidatus Methanobinarius endosymbioticus]
MYAHKMPSVLNSISSPFYNVENITKNVYLLLINFENPATISNIIYKGTFLSKLIQIIVI